MCFRSAEAERSENAGNIGGVVFLEAVLRQYSAIDHPFQAEHSDDIRLRLLECRKYRPDGFPDIHLFTGLARESGPETMRNFMQQDSSQIPLAGCAGRLLLT